MRLRAQQGGGGGGEKLFCLSEREGRRSFRGKDVGREASLASSRRKVDRPSRKSKPHWRRSFDCYWSYVKRRRKSGHLLDQRTFAADLSSENVIMKAFKGGQLSLISPRYETTCTLARGGLEKIE